MYNTKEKSRYFMGIHRFDKRSFFVC